PQPELVHGHVVWRRHPVGKPVRGRRRRTGALPGASERETGIGGRLRRVFGGRPKKRGPGAPDTEASKEGSHGSGEAGAGSSGPESGEGDPRKTDESGGGGFSIRREGGES
ncbi:MAG: hypothetical protein ACOCZ9_04120, partial [Spirochaetota bacterium]